MDAYLKVLDAIENLHIIRKYTNNYRDYYYIKINQKINIKRLSIKSKITKQISKSFEKYEKNNDMYTILDGYIRFPTIYQSNFTKLTWYINGKCFCGTKNCAHKLLNKMIRQILEKNKIEYVLSHKILMFIF